MPFTVKFVNMTTLDFRLKEGNAGVYKQLCTLKGLQSETDVPKEYAVEFDEKATYRDYTARADGEKKLLITLQMCLRYATILFVPPSPDSKTPSKCEIELRDMRSNQSLESNCVHALRACAQKLVRLFTR